MDIFDCIEKRYSFRGKFQNTPVPREHLNKILKAGCAAPSGCNKQTTSFIAIDDAHTLQEIHNLIKKEGTFGNTPPAGIVVLTQRIPGYADVYFNVQDYAAAIENLLLAITGLGYVSCWIEGQVTASEKVQKQISKMLNIPNDYEVIAFLPIGFPEEDGKKPGYKSFNERVSFNKFGKN